ncbi:MAG: metalloregulator ArsR/SmtB family transcription factor [Planctomycetaceae bacterium]|jgi:ArsR family transcriptional regulator|nr:metalloregulator ArsR/SmtB family transcription factor [Planctomycetaceae bacterium]
MKKKDKKLSLGAKAAVFKALAHPTRLQIVEKLAEGEQCVCVLLEMFDIDFSTISRHLSVLKNAGIVVADKQGKNVYYSLKCPCLLDMCDCLDKVLGK